MFTMPKYEESVGIHSRLAGAGGVAAFSSAIVAKKIAAKVLGKSTFKLAAKAAAKMATSKASGAIGGMAAGAAVGSVVPVLGTIAGAVVGTLLANLMFDLSALDTSETIRRGSNLYLSEVIATAGLILLIKILVERDKAKKIPAAVALWIFAAYFFTSSTSFANPAITIGRIFTDTFAGISPDSALRFIPFQIIGGVIGYFIGEIFSEKKSSRAEAVKK
jgi:hypothetical protein